MIYNQQPNENIAQSDLTVERLWELGSAHNRAMHLNESWQRVGQFAKSLGWITDWHRKYFQSQE